MVVGAGPAGESLAAIRERELVGGACPTVSAVRLQLLEAYGI